MKKAKRTKKNTKEETPKVVPGLKERDLIFRPVDHEEVPFHIINPATGEIIGHLRWTRKGRLESKYLKSMYFKED